jgi:hypothetical protein
MTLILSILLLLISWKLTLITGCLPLLISQIIRHTRQATQCAGNGNKRDPHAAVIETQRPTAHSRLWTGESGTAPVCSCFQRGEQLFSSWINFNTRKPLVGVLIVSLLVGILLTAQH